MLGYSLRFSEKYIARRKAAQLDVFQVLKADFATVFQRARAHGVSPSAYTTPTWDQNAANLEAAFLPEPPADFLRNPVLVRTMVANNPRRQDVELPTLEAAYSTDRLLTLLEEDLVGGQRLNVAKYHTSINSIHHAYHLRRFADVVGCDLCDVASVIEWGGGYGNLAKIFLRCALAPVTYVLIDIPLLSAVQWLYLSCVLGPDRVVLVDSPDALIEKGKVNILPVGLAGGHRMECDLFVSTWALSESSAVAQATVFERGWFGARHLLLGYQDSNQDFDVASDVGAMAEACGASIHPIEFSPGNYYAFR